MELALWAGVDPIYRDDDGRSALAATVVHADEEIVPFLLAGGADSNGPRIAELVQESAIAELLELLGAGALTAQDLPTLTELGLNALSNIDTFIEGMVCIFTLGLGC